MPASKTRNDATNRTHLHKKPSFVRQPHVRTHPMGGMQHDVLLSRPSPSLRRTCMQASTQYNQQAKHLHENPLFVRPPHIWTHTMAGVPLGNFSMMNRVAALSLSPMYLRASFDKMLPTSQASSREFLIRASATQTHTHTHTHTQKHIHNGQDDQTMAIDRFWTSLLHRVHV
jgi:hypothetical protein